MGPTFILIFLLFFALVVQMVVLHSLGYPFTLILDYQNQKIFCTLDKNDLNFLLSIALNNQHEKHVGRVR